MDLMFLAEADALTLKLEKARWTFEMARQELESLKRAHDELMSRAEEHGIPKAKLKKLTEERVQLLVETGLLEKAEAPTREAKPKKAKTAKAPSVTEADTSEESESEFPSEFGESSAGDRERDFAEPEVLHS